MQKVKFTKDFVHGNKHVDKKGTTRNVTNRHAAFLVANKFATEVDGKKAEDKKE